ncbi:MAG: hypothetical protein ACP5OV_08005 [Acidimicrobiales bacterium]
MTQPAFVPVPAAGAVRPTTPVAPPVPARPKVGLRRGPQRTGGPQHGTPAPGAGFALTLAARAVAELEFEHEHDRHEVALGVALVAAKRASLINRGPNLDDVHTAMSALGLAPGEPVSDAVAQPFRGLGHSYVRQRAFVDAVSAERLVALA